MACGEEEPRFGVLAGSNDARGFLTWTSHDITRIRVIRARVPAVLAQPMCL